MRPCENHMISAREQVSGPEPLGPDAELRSLAGEGCEETLARWTWLHSDGLSGKTNRSSDGSGTTKSDGS
jgi:hypothetical protein